MKRPAAPVTDIRSAHPTPGILRLATCLLLGCIMAIPLPARAEEADRTVDAAREAAREKRNAEAVVLFEWAISQAPSRRKEWLRELADQMRYAGRSREAVPLYREALAAGHLSPEATRWARLDLARALSWSGQLKASLHEYDALLSENAKDLDARLGRAEILSWMNRHRPAKKEYETVLRQDATNVEARRGLGQVQSWRGRQRDAQRRLLAFLRDHPEDAEGRRHLAQSQHWMGRSDEAQQTLRDLLTLHPGDRDGQRLLAEIQLRGRPETGLDYQSSDQSDDLVISVESFYQNTPFNHGRTTVGPRYQSYRYEPEEGQGPVIVSRPGAHARHRFSDRSELTGNLSVDLIDAEGGSKERTVLTYDTYLTLWPNDVLRFDVGSSRTTFDNIKSLSQGIAATHVSFSTDIVPDNRTRLTARFNWGDYTDGNERRWGQLEAERRVWRAHNIFFGARYTTIGFSKQLDNGYFNPKNYHSGVATLRISGHSGDRFSYDLDGSYGREHADPGGGKPFSSGGTRLTYRVAARTQIEGRYYFFSSRQASSGGFARRGAGVSVRVVW